MKAVITGVNGQDGAFLARDLLERGVEVHGFVRRGSLPKIARTDYLNITDHIHWHRVELTEFSNLFYMLERIKPDYLYNLAAQSFVADSFSFPMLTHRVNFEGYLNILEWARISSSTAQIYQASTSEMYGCIEEKILDEDSLFDPKSPYAVSKLAAHQIGRNYREAYGLNISNGILFNHESELRGREFVTRKVTLQLAEIKRGKRSCLRLGNLNSVRDWGYAPDYVKAMQMMTEAPNSADFVVATNEVHTVRELVTQAAEAIDIRIEFSGFGVDEVGVDVQSGKSIVRVDPAYFRPSDVTHLRGNAAKIRTVLGWKPETSFKTMIGIMARADLDSSLSF